MNKIASFLIFCLIATNGCRTTQKTPINIHIDLYRAYLRYITPKANNYFIGNDMYKKDFTALLKDFPDVNLEDQICLISKKQQKDKDAVEARIAECVAQFAKGNKIKRIITGPGERNVMRGGFFRTKYKVPGLQEDLAKVYVDKDVMKNTLTKNDPSIPTAAYLNLSPTIGAEEFKQQFEKHFSRKIKKVIMKPVASAGSRGNKVFHYSESTDWIPKMHKYLQDLNVNSILEQFVEGKVLRFDSLMGSGELIVNYVSDCSVKPLYFYQNGLPMRYTLINDPKRLKTYDAFAKKSMLALNYTDGVFHLEAIEDNDTGEVYFLETGVRPGGGYDTALESLGYFPVEAYIKSQLDEKYEQGPLSKDVFTVLHVYAPISIANEERRYKVIELSHLKFASVKSYKPELTKWNVEENKNSFATKRELARIVFKDLDRENIETDSKKFKASLHIKLEIVEGKHKGRIYKLKDGKWTHD